MFNTHVRVNLDMLRTRRREMLLVHACIQAKQPFVIDNTNPTLAEREKYILPARASGFRVIGYYFPISIETALLRNTSRSGRQRVPDVAIRGTRNRLQIPSLAEGFSQLLYVRPRPCGGFVVEPWK